VFAGTAHILSAMSAPTFSKEPDIKEVKSAVANLTRRLDAFAIKLTRSFWLTGIVVALAVANFAKQFF